MLIDNPPEISIAIREDDLHKMLQMLADQPAQAQATNENGYAPLHYAARYNRFECAEPLHHYGANITARTIYDDTPLHLAATFASIEFVRWLLVHGAEVNARSQFGQTPLQKALGGKTGYFVRENLIPVVSLLISSGADVNAPDDSGHQSIHSAAGISLEAVKLLVAQGANINAEAEYGYNRSPLLCAMPGKISDELLQERERICDYLLDHGADVNFSDYGSTALHWAAPRQMMKLLYRLLELGADVNAQQDDSGLTPLHLAAMSYDSVDAIRVLLLHGADPNLSDWDGRTSLHALPVRVLSKSFFSCWTMALTWRHEMKWAGPRCIWLPVPFIQKQQKR